jgi:hypothetical protein
VTALLLLGAIPIAFSCGGLMEDDSSPNIVDAGQADAAPRDACTSNCTPQPGIDGRRDCLGLGQQC